MTTRRRTARALRLLLQAGLQHLVDDPALLAIQVSRRLPLGVRSRGGRALSSLAGYLPGGSGAAALGAVMAGDEETARRLLDPPTGRLAGEVAILLGREDLLGGDAAPTTRARAAWARGDLDGAIRVLEDGGRGGARGTERLRSERRLLERGIRLPAPRPRSSEPRAVDDARQTVLHLLTNSLPHTQSGYSLRTHRVLTALAGHGVDSVALTRTGYPVLVGVPGAAEEDRVDGVRYVRCLPARLPQTPQERLEAEVDRALELVQEIRPQVVHATTPWGNGLVAQAVSAATGLPWVYEVRGFAEQTWIASRRTEEAREAAGRSQRARLLAAKDAELAADADAVITLSAAMAEELVRRGVPGERITVVPNGVDEELLAQERTPGAARTAVAAPVPHDALVVGAVSALVDYEGHDLLLDAVALLRADTSVPAPVRERLHVLLVGDGAAASMLTAHARRLGLADRVHLPGRVPASEAPDWVQALDVVVVPRRDRAVTRAVMPQKPVEALALGRPVVASDLPALRETVTARDGSLAARLVAPDDAPALAAALREVLQAEADDTDRRTGRSLAGERTWPALVRRHQEVYAAVLRSSAPRAAAPGGARAR